MTKDYAKRSRGHYTHAAKSNSAKHQRNNPAQVSHLSPFTWLTLGLLLGLLIAAAMYWKFEQSDTHKSTAPNLSDNHLDTQPQGAPVKKLDTQTENAPHSPRFDFYTLLPNMSVEVAENMQQRPQQIQPLREPAHQAPSVPEPETNPNVVRKSPERTLAPVASIPPAQSAYSIPEQFILQLASFKTYEQAETLKARLAFNGIETKIQSIQVASGEKWYRLYLGPFPNRTTAQSAQKKLESEQNMNGLVMKINV